VLLLPLLLPRNATGAAAVEGVIIDVPRNVLSLPSLRPGKRLPLLHLHVLPLKNTLCDLRNLSSSLRNHLFLQACAVAQGTPASPRGSLNWR